MRATANCQKVDAPEVVVSDHARHGYGKLPTRKEYLALIERFFAWDMAVLAGMVEGKLGGFVVAAAVGGTAYIEEIQVHSDALKTGMAGGLLYEMAQLCRRSPGIVEVVHSAHNSEKESLAYFKEDLGFRITPIPCRVWFAPFCEEAVRRLRPHTYYRMFGKQ